MQLAMDHTWDYIRGGLTVKPEESSTKHGPWVAQDWAAHQQITIVMIHITISYSQNISHITSTAWNNHEPW